MKIWHQVFFSVKDSCHREELKNLIETSYPEVQKKVFGLEKFLVINHNKSPEQEALKFEGCVLLVLFSNMSAYRVYLDDVQCEAHARFKKKLYDLYFISFKKDIKVFAIEENNLK